MKEHNADSFEDFLKDRAEGFNIKPSGDFFAKIQKERDAAPDGSFEDLLKTHASNFEPKASIDLFDKIQNQRKNAAHGKDSFAEFLRKRAQSFERILSDDFFEKIQQRRFKRTAARYVLLSSLVLLIISALSYSTYFWVEYNQYKKASTSSTAYTTEIKANEIPNKSSVNKASASSENELKQTHVAKKANAKQNVIEPGFISAVAPPKSSYKITQSISRKVKTKSQVKTQNDIEEGVVSTHEITCFEESSNNNSSENNSAAVKVENGHTVQSAATNLAGNETAKKDNSIQESIIVDHAVTSNETQNTPLLTNDSISNNNSISTEATHIKSPIVTHKWGLVIGANYSVINSDISYDEKYDGNWMDEIIDGKKSLDKTAIAYRLSATIERSISKRFTVSAGIGIQNVHFVDYRVNQTYIDFSGSSSGGLQVNEAQYTQRKSYISDFRYLDIPVQLQYIIPIHKFNLAVQGGISYNRLIQASGVLCKLGDTSSTYVCRSINDPSYNKNLFYLNTGLIVSYPLSDNLLILAGPQMRLPLNSIYGDQYMISQKTYISGIMLGIKFRY